MRYYSRNSALASPAYRRIVEYLFTSRAFFLHAVLFVGALLIGIARYSHSVPPDLTILMTFWSVGLLLHGFVTYREEQATQTSTRKQQDGVLRTMLLSVVVNAVMWGMWALATDAQDASPWHLSVFLVYMTAAVLAIIVGKRALYAHWLESYRRDHPDVLTEAKQKREFTPESRLRLAEDGELFDYLEDMNDPIMRDDSTAE